MCLHNPLLTHKVTLKVFKQTQKKTSCHEIPTTHAPLCLSTSTITPIKGIELCHQDHRECYSIKLDI